MAEKKQGRRSAEAAEATKLQILRVAADMFCNQGYERVSLRNISEAANVSHSLIRHHFGSKEKIWYAVSDKLHEYMERYIFELLEDIDKELPPNIRLYQFSIRLLAHLLLVPKPIQFTADIVRQENEFYDYFVDKHGQIESTFQDLIDTFNETHPGHEVNMWEHKWLIISNAHSATSLKPFLNHIWPENEGNYEKNLLKSWELFNDYVSKAYLVPENEILHPDDLKPLLLPLAACLGSDSDCEMNCGKED